MPEHPSLEDIALFVHGKLLDPSVIEQHLDECADCATEAVLGREMRYLDALGLIGRSPPSDSADQHGGEGFTESSERDVTSRSIPASHSEESKYGSVPLERLRRTARSVPGSPATAPGFTRWRRRMAIAGALAACLLIGLLGGLAWNRATDTKPFDVLIAQADTRPVGSRGQPDEGRAVVIQSAHKGFASIVALFKDNSPMVFPSRAAGPLPVPSGALVESPPLPPGLMGATVLLIVITEQPAADVIHQIVAGTAFGPHQIEDLRRLLTEKLQASNYRWVAYATATQTRP